MAAGGGGEGGGEGEAEEAAEAAEELRTMRSCGTQCSLHSFLNRNYVLKRINSVRGCLLSRGARRSCKRKGSCAGIQLKRGSSTEPHSIMCLMPTKSPEHGKASNRNWNRIAVAAHYRDPAPSCRPPPALSATEREKLLQLTSHVALPAAAPLTPAPQRSRPLAPQRSISSSCYSMALSCF